ncbi:MAG: flagellar protein FlaG [Lachnospiraceae bacterium]|nr:flagellar protein FlaG [Lachnospiraceae bacterium]
MAIEAMRSTGASYQPASKSEVKEVSKPKIQVTESPVISAAFTENDANVNARESREQQGSNQEQRGHSNTDKIKKAIEQINKKVINSEAVFGFHEGTNRVMIKIVDKETKEIIKEFPPEETLDMIAKVWELAGILIDEKR